MSNANNQIRGICQCCGREQAVVSGGRMSNHGYTVKDGWFQGVCTGNNFAPMQVSRAEADRVVAHVRKDVEDLKVKLQGVIAGTIKPEFAVRRVRERQASGLTKAVDKIIPFAELNEYEQRNEVKLFQHKLENRIASGTYFANELEGLADKYHGTELKEVARPAPTAHIEKGEKRQGQKYVLIARYQEGARVYWKTETGLQGWTGSKAWRSMPLVADETKQESPV